MRTAVLAITSGGRRLAEKLCRKLDKATLLEKEAGQKVAATIAANWDSYDSFVCIMSAGIVVRSIAPLLKEKTTDPCVVVLDERGHHAISLLSGHLGGGNSLARKVAALLGGSPVITTASDTLDLVPLDLWLQEQGLRPFQGKVVTTLSSRLVNRGSLALYTDMVVTSLPPGIRRVDKEHQADFIISNVTDGKVTCPVIRLPNLVVGIGCNRNTPAREFEEALDELFKELHLSRTSIRNLASIDKKNDETGLLQFGRKNGWSIDFFDSRTINTLNNLEISFAALKAVGAIGVAEPAALLSAQSTHLISRKRKWKNVTMAVAEVPFTLSAQVRDQYNT